MANGDGYTVKEILTEIVIPRLDKIEAKLDEKVSVTEFKELERRMAVVESESLDPEKVRDLIRKSLQDESAIAWTSRARIMQIGFFLVAVGSLTMSILMALNQ